MTQEQIDKLPKWAQVEVRRLMDKPATLIAERVELFKKIEGLQQTNRKQADRIEAMVAMFMCAAKGENEVAKAVKSIVEEFLSHEQT